MNSKIEMNADPSPTAHPTAARPEAARAPSSTKHTTAPRQRAAHALLSGALLAASGLALIAGEAQAVGATTRVSVGSAAQEGNSIAELPRLSADGRFVAFTSWADNLVPGDNNHVYDVFVHDRQTHQTTRVNVNSQGIESNSFPSELGDISATGRFVVFDSYANNLVPDDTNGSGDVFVHDRQTRQTTLVSVDSAGNSGNSASHTGAISANGRYVAFFSVATKFSPACRANKQGSVFVHDRLTHQTTCVSVNSKGIQNNLQSRHAAISADGRFVAFDSESSNLAPDDTYTYDVFVHDRQTRQTTLVSVDSAGQKGNNDSANPAISGDGRFVAFISSADNLVSDDTNGNIDVFVHDRVTHETTRVGIEVKANGSAYSMCRYECWSALSADGRFVAFTSSASGLVPGDANGAKPDVLVHDRLTGQTTVASVNSAGRNTWVRGEYPSISGDGRVVAFMSSAAGLVPGDTNNVPDIFVRDRLLDRSARADLRITQTVDPDPFQPLSPLTYTVTAVNKGPDAASEVTLYDRLPGSGTLVSAVPSQGQCSGGAPLVCYLGTLEAGASSTVTLTLKPKWQGVTSLWNSAQINAAPVDPRVANNKATVHVQGAP